MIKFNSYDILCWLMLVFNGTFNMKLTADCNVQVSFKERKSIYIAPFCIKVHAKRSGMDHTVLLANNTMPAFPFVAFTRCHHHSN